MVTKSIQNADIRRQWYEAMGVPHEIVVGRSIQIVTESYGDKKKEFFSDDTLLSTEDLQMINKVRRYATQYGPTFKVHKSEVSWNRISDRPGVHRGFREFDITKAYWTVAREKGVISEEIYQHGLKVDDNGDRVVSKKVLLMSLGSLAAKKDLYEFDGSQRFFRRTIYNERTAAMFFAIAKRVGEIMTQIYINTDCLGFWVDACFVRDYPENTERVHEIARRYGVSLHDVELSPSLMITKTKMGPMMYCIEVHERSDSAFSIRPKCFMLSEHKDVNACRVKFMDRLTKNLKYGNLQL